MGLSAAILQIRHNAHRRRRSWVSPDKTKAEIKDQKEPREEVWCPRRFDNWRIRLRFCRVDRSSGEGGDGRSVHTHARAQPRHILLPQGTSAEAANAAKREPPLPEVGNPERRAASRQEAREPQPRRISRRAFLLSANVREFTPPVNRHNEQ